MTDKPQTIDTIYAFIATEDDGNEGITGFYYSNSWMPMVCADMSRVKSLRPIAQKIASQSGKTVKLVHFSVRTEVEIIECAINISEETL